MARSLRVVNRERFFDYKRDTEDLAMQSTDHSKANTGDSGSLLMRGKKLCRGMLAVAALAVAAGSANASVIYTLVGSAPADGGTIPGQSFSATLTLPDFITSDLTGADWDSCLIGDGTLYECIAPTFEPALNGFGGNDDFIGFSYNDLVNGGGGTGFLFFEAGAFGAPGIYSNNGYPVATPGYGNFAPARLIVEGDGQPAPVPGSLPLLLLGLGSIGAALRRGRRVPD